MVRMVSFAKCLAMIALVVTVAWSLDAHAKGKGPDPGSCPRKGIECPAVYDPVTCDNGVTYSNACVAYVFCAENCVPAGDPSFAGKGKGKPKPPCQCPIIPFPDGSYCYDEDCVEPCEYICTS